MPLNKEDRDNILRYCDRDVPNEAIVNGFFDFIADERLRSAIVKEYLAARYIYKLGEALAVSDAKLAAHAKFQIVQFASIYEAVIVHTLWTHFREHDEVKRIETAKVWKKAATMPANVTMKTNEGLDLSLCYESAQTVTTHAIKFDDKVDAAVAIGFIDRTIAEEIKEFFWLRNGVHIENAVKKEIEYEIAQSQNAFWRLKPLLIGVRGFLRTGQLPEGAKPTAKVQNLEAPKEPDQAS